MDTGIPTKLKNLVVSTCLLLFLACLSSKVAAQGNIFAPPVKLDKPSPGSYPTAQALLEATRSSEIPDKLRSGDVTFQENIGRSVYIILQKDYGLNKDNMLGDPSGQQFGFGELLRDLTLFEFSENKRELADRFQRKLNDMFGGPNAPGSYRFDTRKFDDSRAIFTKFAAQYTKAIKEGIVFKRQQEEQHQEEMAVQQRQAVLKERQMAEEQRKHKEEMDGRLAVQKAADDAKDRKDAEEQRKQQELVDARQASQKAEDDIRDAAMKGSLARAKEARKQKLAEILASPAYKMWEAALVVQQGEKMISSAQSVLDHDEAVQRESGVTNLSERRAAGEQIVAGKNLVETAFAAYKNQEETPLIPKRLSLVLIQRLTIGRTGE